MAEIEELSARNQEIMKRLLEGQNSRQISEALQLQPSTIRMITTSPMFKRELQKRRETEIRGIATRLEDLTPEAVDVLKDYMRQKGNYERQRLAAALEILDRAGYVKIQKQITVGINAEDVIKALARLKAGDLDVVDATIVEGDSGEQDSTGHVEVVTPSLGDDQGRHDNDTGLSRPEEPDKEVPSVPLAGSGDERVVREQPPGGAKEPPDDVDLASLFLQLVAGHV